MASKNVTVTAELFVAEKTQRSYVLLKFDGAPFASYRSPMIANHKETLEAAAAELLRMAKNAPATIAAPVKAAGKQAAGTACSCGGSIPAGSRFCPGCGTAAVQPASCACGTSIPTGARFCPGCGKDRQATLSAPVVTATNGTVSVDAAV